MDNWKFHDKQMVKLKQLYLKTSKQTQNKLQGIIDTFKFDFNTLYNIADTKTKNRIKANTIIIVILKTKYIAHNPPIMIRLVITLTKNTIVQFEQRQPQQL